jgi:outer membrane lipoprotein-sorting protein
MTPDNNIESQLDQLARTLDDGSSIVPDVMARIREQQRLQGPRILKLSKRRIIVSRITKIAIAAVIIIGVVFGYQFFTKTTSIALADVYQRVININAYSYRAEMTMNGSMGEGIPAQNIEMDVTVTVASDYGMKMETDMTMLDSGQKTTQQMYIVPDEGAMYMLMPEQKMYAKIQFTDDLLERMRKQNNDPREMVAQMLGSEYTELGQSKIDGVTVLGFETTDPAYAGGMADNLTSRMWVDAKTGLPFRAEMEMSMGENMRMSAVMLDFQWDITASADEFKPVIPEDYKLMPGGDIKLPKMDAEAAIEGLKFFLEMTGEFPKSLNLMSLMQDTSKIIRQDELQEKLKAAKEAGEDEVAVITKFTQEITRPMQSLGMFYMTLVQEKKEPVYYGETVGPGDAGKILLRWKESDDLYNVIYGDLAVDKVTAERLAELENGQ